MTLISILCASGCAGEEALDESSSADVELDWDTDEALDSDLPACAADSPDCDRIDDADTPEEAAELTAEAGGGIHDDALGDDPAALPALADPKSGGKFRIWPGGRIPYRLLTNSNGTYQLNAATRGRLSQAMTNWEKLTEGRIKFRKRLATDKAYVTIGVGSSQVSPYVGYRAGSVQHLTLRQDEYITVMKHELGHVVGFHHEQRRSDRLSYIQVRTANIRNTSLCKYQFSTCTDCAKVGTYDVSSIMHYRTTDLGNCRTGPVLLKKSGAAISHYWQLSTRDRNAVAAMYRANAGIAPSLTAPDALPETGSLVAAGRCADVAGGATAEGAKIVGASCEGAGSQDWRATRNGQLRVKHSLRCTAVAGDSVPGAAVEQAICSASAADQKWRFDDMEIVHGATGQCLDTAGGLGIASCSGSASQKLGYQAEREAIVAGGLCLTAAGDRATLQACDGSAGQRWFQGRGGFVSRANTGRCMQVAEAGTAIELADCADEPGQRWALRGAIRDDRAGLCVQSGAASELALARCDGSSPQTWTFWSR